ncbi:MAG: protein kinase [Gemmatimonadales bacterium]|nr:protein kinase [Gemmatimonadales bacterium]
MSDPLHKPLAQRVAESLGDAYTIEGEIGRGGMGVVYRARDEQLKRRVAIKVLPPELAFQQDIRERFKREAQTAGQLLHPHIVPIYSVGEASGLVYFVMGYVDGESVSGRVKRKGPLPADEARRIMKETADALSAAHAVSVIHRDIKPDNILLEGTRGRVMVTDFGIAKAMSSSSGATLTGAGVAIGTPAFMSPEQAAGEKEIDPRSDLYSLGIVAYQMLTGDLPFAAPTVAGILMKQITEPAPDVRAKRPDVPEDLALAVARCLEKDPTNRWPTADALRRALETRTVGGYRPTGTSWRAAPRPHEPAAAPRSPRPATSPRRGYAERPAPVPVEVPRRAAELPVRRPQVDPRRGPQRDEETGEIVRDTGEPRIVQKVRQQFATWLAVNGGLFMLNIATTQLDPPWFLFPAAGMGIGLLNNYAKLWQAGYSWRDVLTRPPAPDSIESSRDGRAPLPKALPAPTPSEFGEQYLVVKQAHADRQAILKLVEKLPPSERQVLSDIQETVDGLYRRAADLSRTLHLLDQEMGQGDVSRLDQRLAMLRQQPADEERERQISLLERQKKTVADLADRRAQVTRHLDSCVLAMQNLRLDLLKLKSSNVAEVMGDITQATQAARAISRNVDNAIVAAGEIEEAMGR